MLQVRNETMNVNGSKQEESNSSYKGQQKYKFITDNWKQKEKQKTYAEALKELLEIK